VPTGEQYCFQHSHGLLNRIRYLHKSTRAVFWVPIVLSLILTVPFWPILQLGYHRALTDFGSPPTPHLDSHFYPRPPKIPYDKTPAPERRTENGKHRDLREAKFRVVFQDDKPLTDQIKNDMRTEIAQLQDYFAGLGLTMPSELPPIGSTDKVKDSIIGNFGSRPYLGVILIGEASLRNRTVIANTYIRWCFTQLALTASRSASADADAYVNVAGVFIAYYTISFLNQEPHGRGWAFALANVRSKYGREFTDRMVAYAFRSILDDPQLYKDKTVESCLLSSLAVGEFAMNTGMARWPEIQMVLQTRFDPSSANAQAHR